jgi:hypothetical protein
LYAGRHGSIGSPLEGLPIDEEAEEPVQESQERGRSKGEPHAAGAGHGGVPETIRLIFEERSRLTSALMTSRLRAEVAMREVCTFAYQADNHFRSDLGCRSDSIDRSWSIPRWMQLVCTT